MKGLDLMSFLRRARVPLAAFSLFLLFNSAVAMQKESLGTETSLRCGKADTARASIPCICGKDPKTADRYEARSRALRSISRRCDLSQEDVAALMAYVSATDGVLRVEREAALKNDALNLLRNQQTVPNGLAEFLVTIVERKRHAPEIIDYYIPFYDANGNITKYLDADGNVVASYTYDAFGNMLVQSGSLADAFAFYFSTKYHDAESGLYYYGKRFYSSSLRRWLNRDPIEEDGGENLYAFCKNTPMSLYDVQGTFSLNEWTGAIAKIRSLQDQLASAVEAIKGCLATIDAWRPGGVHDSATDDKYRHCVASCEISKACGERVSLALGLVKEMRDVIFSVPQNVAAHLGLLDIEVSLDSLLNGDDFDDNIEDLTADVMGIDVKNVKGGCACACKEYYKP